MAENRISDSVTSSDEVGNKETSKLKLVTAEFDSTFGTKTWREDTILIVEGKRLHVSSSVLSLLSPVFTRMFEEKIGGDGPMEIELDGKNYDDFLEFLKCFYPNIMKRVTLDNVFVVLPIAVEFSAERLVKNCEDALIEITDETTKAEDIFKYLSKAFEYELTRLQKKCTEEACKQNYKDFKEAEKKYPIPVEAKLEIQSKMFESLESINEKYEKELKSVNLLDLLFKGRAPSDMKKPRVGYLEHYFKMPNYSCRNSRQVTVHAINWSISVDTSDRKNLAVHLYAQPIKDHTAWQCQTYAIFCLCNFKNDSESVREWTGGVHTSSGNGWGSPRLAEMKKITDKGAGFLQDGNVKIEVYFIVEEPTFD